MYTINWLVSSALFIILCGYVIAMSIISLYVLCQYYMHVCTEKLLRAIYDVKQSLKFMMFSLTLLFYIV